MLTLGDIIAILTLFLGGFYLFGQLEIASLLMNIVLVLIAIRTFALVFLPKMKGI